MFAKTIIAPVLVALLMIAALGSAASEECTSEGKVVTEIVAVDGKLQIKAYTTGYCNAWEAIGHGLSAAIAEARRAQTEKAPPAVALATSAKQ